MLYVCLVCFGMDSDGFTLVTRGARREVGRKHRRAHSCTNGLERLGTLKPTLPEMANRARFICQEVIEAKSNPKLKAVVSTIVEGLPSGFSCAKVVCYGVGSFSESCHNSRLQLALVLSLQESLGVAPAEVYDPIHNGEDKEVLSLLGCELGCSNENGKQPSLSSHGSTLYVMPHCSMRLYSNLLWRLWEPELLLKIAVIGNSFSSYEGRLISAKEKGDGTNCILRVANYVTETCLTSGLAHRSNLYNALSDTSLLTFQPERLRQATAAGLFTHAPQEYMGEIDC